MSDINLKTVPALPFWLSAANSEFAGNGWASDVLAKASIPAPQWLSQLAGRSAKTHTMTIGTFGNKRYGFSSTTPQNITAGKIDPYKTTDYGYWFKEMSVSEFDTFLQIYLYVENSSSPMPSTCYLKIPSIGLDTSITGTWELASSSGYMHRRKAVSLTTAQRDAIIAIGSGRTLDFALTGI